MRVAAATPLCPGRQGSAIALVVGSLFLLSLARPTPCLAGGGILGIDHELTYDNSGIWKRNYQEVLEYGLIGGEVVGALWEGGETRFGRTLWQSVDASAAAGITAVALKYAFSRTADRQ